MSPALPDPHDDAAFRLVLGHFASGLVVVTGVSDTTPVGFTCQSFFSLSLDPPRIALAAGTASSSWHAIREAERFCVNILSERQAPLARTFATSGTDKFKSVRWMPSIHGAPRLHGVLAWVDCRIARVHPGGDHDLVVGDVIAFGAGDGDPTIYFRSEFRQLRAPVE